MAEMGVGRGDMSGVVGGDVDLTVAGEISRRGEKVRVD